MANQRGTVGQEKAINRIKTVDTKRNGGVLSVISGLISHISSQPRKQSCKTRRLCEHLEASGRAERAAAPGNTYNRVRKKRTR